MAKSKKNKKKQATINSQKKTGKFVDLRNAKNTKTNTRKTQGR